MLNALSKQLKRKLFATEVGMSDSLRLPYYTALRWGKTVASVALNLSLPLYHLKSETEPDGPSIAYVGPKDSTFRFIADLIYDKIPQLTPVTHISLLNLKSAIEPLKADYDVVLVMAPYRVLRPLANKEGLLTTSHINMEINTQRSWEDIQRNFRQDSVKKQLRKLNAANFDYVHTTELVDFDHFYHNIYQPFVKERFGQVANISSQQELSLIFSVGWLVQFRQADELRGGALNFVKANTLYNYVIGMPTVLTEAERTQVMTANYYYSIQKAIAEGYRAVNLGWTRPFLNDGIALYKRKWGAEVVPDPDQNWGLWLNVGRDTALARQFLVRRPWIGLDPANQPTGFMVVDADTKPDRAKLDNICKLLWLPGLKSIQVYSPLGFGPDVKLVNSPFSALSPVAAWQPEDI